MILYIGAYLPVIRNFQNAPSDRYYYGGEEYPLDMTYNLATMRIGYDDNWLGFLKITSYFPDKMSLLKIEYVLLGQLARLFSIDPTLMYHISKIIISFLYVTVLYFIISRVFHDRIKRSIALIFTILGPSINFTGENTGYLLRAIVDALIFQRMTTAAHHYLLGGISALLSVYLLSRTLETSKTGLYIWSCLLGIVSAHVYAPNTVIVLSTLPFVWLILLYQNTIAKTRKTSIKLMTLLFLSYGITVSLPILYVQYVMVGPWNVFNVTGKLERLNPFILTPREYFESLGVTYILSFVSIPFILRRGNPFLILLLPWIIMHPFGEYVLSPILGINKIRYFLTPYFIVFGLLATEGVTSLAGLIVSKKRVLRYGIYLSSIVLVIGSGWFAYLRSYERALVCFCNVKYFDYGYPKKDIMDVLVWLRSNSKETDIVLSDTYAGVLIPAFSGNRVYTSWWFRLTEVGAYFQTTNVSRHFYTGTMTNKDALNFLRENNISYVFVGEKEREYAEGMKELRYPMLSLVFQSGETRLYKVEY